MKILFINPGQLADAGEDQFSGRIDTVFFRVNPFSDTYFGIPLAIPTLAAVTPARHSVKIIDEMVDAVDFDEPCDLVGLSAMTCKATRAYQIAEEFRIRGVPVIMGGIHASMCPDEAAGHVDTVVIGEAEEIWPGILDDLENGRMKPRYRADDFPDLCLLPPPRHDLTHHKRYFSFFLQTTRGCPRACKFCTVTAINGRSLRKKRPEQVVDEVREVLALGNRRLPEVVDRDEGNRKKKLANVSVFFVDDNFAVDRQHALAVCRALKRYQDETGVLLSWFTQADIKTGFDDELLGEMKTAGCMNIFIGFESLLSETLAAMKKGINTPERYVSCVRNIESFGIEVTFSIIVGTDSETTDSGGAIVDFVTENNIFYLFPNILTPYPGTALMQEMEKDNRVILRHPELYNIRNVVFRPRRMTPLQLQKMFTDMCESAFSLESLLDRGMATLKQPKRYYLTRGWRLIVFLTFSFLFVVLALQGKLGRRDLFKLFRALPSLILSNGSLSALGIIVNTVGFCLFGRSEVRRFPFSPASVLPELGAHQASDESSTDPLSINS